METKSFLIEEHKETIFDNEKIKEWKETAESIGAEGQIKLLNNEPGSPLPFPIMTEAEVAIYEEILETREGYKSFSAMAIPLQGLSLIALCEKEKYFDKIQVWYSREDPDPLIIGLRYTDEKDREKGYDWNMDKYLIFQWGAKLKKLIDLIPAFRERKIADAERHHKNALEAIERNVERYKFQCEAYQ